MSLTTDSVGTLGDVQPLFGEVYPFGHPIVWATNVSSKTNDG
jgi:hypothetical protein